MPVSYGFDWQAGFGIFRSWQYCIWPFCRLGNDFYIVFAYPQWTKGHTVGEEPIFAPVSLLSFRVRPVRVNQAPRRDKNWLLSDSLTLTIDISVIYKEDDWGVLDVRWLRTTQKITEISWFRACVPLSTEGKQSHFRTGNFCASPKMALLITFVIFSFNWNDHKNFWFLLFIHFFWIFWQKSTDFYNNYTRI